MSTRKAKVNINLPLKLLEAGLNIASQFKPEISSEQMMETVREGLSEIIPGEVSRLD